MEYLLKVVLSVLQNTEVLSNTDDQTGPATVYKQLQLRWRFEVVSAQSGLGMGDTVWESN